jgi:hypothetical protein
LLSQKYEIIMVPFKHSFFQYCNNNIFLKAIEKRLPLRAITLWEAIQKSSTNL